MSIEEKLFNQMNETSGYWHNKSADLISSAGVLWKYGTDGNDYCHFNTYKMLMGMSFESIAKAFCIAQNKTLKPTHDITALMSDAGFKFSKIENRTLKALTSYVEWAGKYPTPLTKKGSGPKTLVEHWKELSSLGDEAFDYEILHKMWRKMSDKYMSEHNT